VSLIQRPAETAREIEASRPLDIPPEEVAAMDEATWLERAYRRDAPQLTVRALVMGTILGFFLSFSNVYIGLKTGWFLGVNITACILSFAIWSSLTRSGLAKSPMSILETTCAASTASSAGYATGFVAITSAPAMLLLSVSEATPGGVRLPWPVMAVWIFFLAAFGVVLAIPMKRSMINREKLRFPSGTAAAVTLQGLYGEGSEALRRARMLFATAGVSALGPLLTGLMVRKVGVDPATGKTLRDALLPGQSSIFDWIPRVLPESWTHRMLNAGPAKLHPGGQPFSLGDFHVKLDHGLALVFAGILVGIRITSWMVVGGLFLVVVLAPPAMDAPWQNSLGVVVGAVTKPGSSWKEIGIWTGAPLLVGSGLVTFAAQWRTVGRLVGSVRRGKGSESGSGATATGDETSRSDQERERAEIEVPNRWFASGILLAGAGVVTVAWRAFDIPLHLGLLAISMTFLLAIVACRATGESDITPGGPFGKIMQLTYGVLIPQNAAGNLQTAAVTASASLASADLLNDLKCGYLLGANPRRQFVAQAAGILTGTIATTLCYFVLVPDASVLLGSAGHAPTFPAPGAQQWKAVAEVFRYGLDNLHPMSRSAIRWGLLAGIVLGSVEALVPPRLRKWVPSPTGLGLGMVLPFFYPLAMFLGAAASELATAWNKAWAERYVVAIAAGGIAGESIVGVVVQAINNFVLV